MAWADQESRPYKVAALVGALCGSFVLPEKQISTVVEYNMCTMTGYYESGEIEGEYLSEPALAAGARHCLRHVSPLPDVLRCMKQGFAGSPPNPGDLGELVCILSLLECMEAAVQAHSTVPNDVMFPVVSIRDLAKQIIPLSILSEGDFPDDEFVSFNHFVRLPRSQFSESSERKDTAYGRCAAVVAYFNEAGIDGFIPVVKQDGTLGEWDVQIKNRKRAGEPASGRGDYPMLFIEMGDESVQAKRISLSRGQSRAVYYLSMWRAPFFESTNGSQVLDELKKTAALSRRGRSGIAYKRKFPRSSRV